LHEGERLLHGGGAGRTLAGDILEWGAKVSVVIEVSDDGQAELSRRSVVRRPPKLVLEVMGEGAGRVQAPVLPRGGRTLSHSRETAATAMPPTPAGTRLAMHSDRGDAMKTRLLQHHGGAKTYAIVFDTGEEVVSGLTVFAREHAVGAAHLTAIGAFQDLVLGYFDWRAKSYRRIPLSEQVEVIALLGDIALKDGQPSLHAHVVVGKADGTAHGGHLLEGHVRPTLEVIAMESPAHLQRVHDPVSGLALIRP
jgi:hypothetical protein